MRLISILDFDSAIKMNSLIGLIYSLTFLYIVSGDAQVYMPSVEDGDDDGQTGGQSDDPVNTPINQDDQAPAATQPAVITTSLADSGDGKIPFTQKPFIAKLIDKSNNIYHKESKDRRSFIISNIEAYKLPANNLLIRSRFIGAIDWIIHKPDFESNNLPFIRPGTAVNHGKSANHLKLLLRNKRQADSYGMPNPGNGQGPPMGAGDRPMGNNPVGGIRQFFGRLREIMNDIRRAFSGNRVDTNMQGMGNMPGMGNTPGMEENLPNLPK